MFLQPLQQQSQTQHYISNIPTHKPSSFQQTLPRYNPPPNPRRGRYTNATLIPVPGSIIQHHPALISPASSTASSVQVIQESLRKSNSRNPSQGLEMLKFQVRKSDVDTAAPPPSHSTSNPQIQVSLFIIIQNLLSLV